MDDGTILSIILIVFFVICSGAFSATETAFSCLNRARLRNMADNGNKRAGKTLKLVDDYDKLLTSILVGNNVVNIAMASISAVLFIRILPNAGATVSTLVITVVVLIFGEVSPKTLARQNPEKFAMFMTPVMDILVHILTPINYLFAQWQNMLRKIFKIGSTQSMTQDELSVLVEEASEEGNIDAEESALLRNALAFEDQEAQDVLTPRVDMVAVSVDTPNDEVARLFAEDNFSRLPVYEGSIDHIVGILYEKDFYTKDGISKTPIEKLMREPVFVPNTIKIDDLFLIFKQNNSHIAIVSDEFGGTMGLVTMEDILEELVGEIWDEHDQQVDIIKETGENTYLILGSADMDQLEQLLGIKLDSESSTTAGGWVMEQIGHIPAVGESFTYDNDVFTVTAADGNRVLEIEIKKGTPQEEPEED